MIRICLQQWVVVFLICFVVSGCAEKTVDAKVVEGVYLTCPENFERYPTRLLMKEGKFKHWFGPEIEGAYLVEGTYAVEEGRVSFTGGVEGESKTYALVAFWRGDDLILGSDTEIAGLQKEPAEKPWASVVRVGEPEDANLKYSLAKLPGEHPCMGK